MTVMFAKERVKRGLIKKEDVPYMQRGGNWDNTDVEGATRVDWTKADARYESGEGPISFSGGGGAKMKTEEDQVPSQKKGFSDPASAGLTRAVYSSNVSIPQIIDDYAVDVRANNSVPETLGSTRFSKSCMIERHASVLDAR